jgi:hypothetical protein
VFRGENQSAFPTRVRSPALSSWLDMLAIFRCFLANLLSARAMEGETCVVLGCLAADQWGLPGFHVTIVVSRWELDLFVSH